MKKVSVRCWEVTNYSTGKDTPHRLYISYPEENGGHELITCIKCGAIYAVTVVKEVYTGPSLIEKLRDLTCMNCGGALSGNFAYYPETYLADGEIHSFKRSQEIPPAEDSIIKEFYGIYE